MRGRRAAVLLLHTKWKSCSRRDSALLGKPFDLLHRRHLLPKPDLLHQEVQGSKLWPVICLVSSWGAWRTGGRRAIFFQLLMDSFILDFKEICNKTDVFPARFDLSDFDVSIKTACQKKPHQNKLLPCALVRQVHRK